MAVAAQPMKDAFLVFMLVSFAPLAFPVAAGSSMEHVCFVGWRWLQVVVLAAAFGYVLMQLRRAPWVDRAIMLVLLMLALLAAASYGKVEWDAQIEYDRVVVLADRYGGLWNGYLHGIQWILGYPPGTSLSALWYRTLHVPSPNWAQMALFLLWSATFLLRHLRAVDGLSKCLFFGTLIVMPMMQWHLYYFYNNLFFALISAEIVLLPLFDSRQEAWEQCGYALVLIWLRPQFALTAIPLVSAALTRLLTERRDRRARYDVVAALLLALLVAWFGARFWARMMPRLSDLQTQHYADVAHAVAATQDQHVLDIEIATHMDPPPTPPVLSNDSLGAIEWAYETSMGVVARSVWIMIGGALFAVVVLRRRGLAFFVPIVTPAAFIVGTAVFARSYPAYRDNAWALERLQLVTSVFAAGIIAALHFQLRRRQDLVGPDKEAS